MDPHLKAFLNSIKCPVCGGQIEGVERFFCAFTKQHYSLYINSEVTPITITYEAVRLNEGKRQYYILQEENKTEIYVFQLNGDYQIIPTDKTKTAPKSIKFDKKIFSFTNTTREKLLNRVKTILVFS